MARPSARGTPATRSCCIPSSATWVNDNVGMEETMKKNRSAYFMTMTLFAVLAIPVGATAQNGQPHQAHHYHLVDLGTFGGPQSYFSLLNNAGTVAGFGDTPNPDPFPTYYWVDGYAVNAFRAGTEGSLTDLGALPAGNSVALWIAGNGLIAGASENGETDPLYAGLPQVRAILWQNEKIIDLGTLPEGGYQSEANAVNSSGQVVGAAYNTVPDSNPMGTFWLFGGEGGIEPPYPAQTRAFLWDPQNGMQDLGTLGDGTDAQALYINERGQVAGVSYTGSNPSPSCDYPLATSSFLWEKGKGMRNLGGLGGTCTEAGALNNQGQVVGFSNLKGDQAYSAFLWKNGKIQRLEGLGGTYSDAHAINDAGQSVGFAYFAGDTIGHASLWNEDGKVTDLGTVGTDLCSYSWAINSQTQVVGGSKPTCTSESDRAFLWEEGAIYDLNTLIPPNSPLYLCCVGSINDRGEMGGYGVDANANQHAFLLIPCDENHPGVEGCDYSLVDAATAAQVSSAPAFQSRPGTNENRLRRMVRRQYPSRTLGVGPQK